MPNVLQSVVVCGRVLPKKYYVSTSKAWPTGDECHPRLLRLRMRLRKNIRNGGAHLNIENNYTDDT